MVAAFLIYTVVINVLMHEKSPGASLNYDINQGFELWQSRNCQACHQLYGLGGYMGPDLTNASSVVGEDYMKAIMKSGTSRMPDFHLSEEEIDKLTLFLKWVDESGRSAVDAKSVHWSGTYTID